jgi:hypothetical protein
LVSDEHLMTDERLDLLPPRYSISQVGGVGSRSQADFLLSPERLPPPGAFFIRLTLEELAA